MIAPVMAPAKWATWSDDTSCSVAAFHSITMSVMTYYPKTQASSILSALKWVTSTTAHENRPKMPPDAPKYLNLGKLGKKR